MGTERTSKYVVADVPDAVDSVFVDGLELTREKSQLLTESQAQRVAKAGVKLETPEEAYKRQEVSTQEDPPVENEGSAEAAGLNPPADKDLGA